MTAVYRDCGNGSYPIEDWRQLWQAWWEGIAYAIGYASRGSCSCGCVVEICNYCASECCEVSR